MVKSRTQMDPILGVVTTPDLCLEDLHIYHLPIDLLWYLWRKTVKVCEGDIPDGGGGCSI